MDAYSQGFVKACQDRGVDTTVPSRVGSYVSNILPGVGPAIYGAVKKPGNRMVGAAQGLGGEFVGTSIGAIGGGTAGMATGAAGMGLAYAAALIARKPELAAKIKSKMPRGVSLGGGVGSVAGGLAGGGEGVYRTVNG